MAKDDPSNAAWQRDVAVSHRKIGAVQRAQGNLAAALESYEAYLAIAERLAKGDPSDAEWQRGVAVSYKKIGDMQVAQGNLPAALESYRALLAIRERLVRADAGNAAWQRDLVASYGKLSEVTGDKAYAAKARDIALDMQKHGTLAPRDAWMIDELKRRAGE